MTSPWKVDIPSQWQPLCERQIMNYRYTMVVGIDGQKPPMQNVHYLKFFVW